MSDAIVSTDDYQSPTHSVSFSANGYIEQTLASPIDGDLIESLSFRYYLWAGDFPKFYMTIYYDDETTDTTVQFGKSGTWEAAGCTATVDTEKSVEKIRIYIDSFTSGTAFVDDVSLSLADATVLQLSFDNETSTTVYDWSGNDNNGVITGASRSYDGHFGMGLSFDGTDYITVLDCDALDLDTVITFSTWLKPSTVSGNQIIYDKPNAYGLYLFDDAIGMMINNDYFNTSTGVVDANTWYHIIGEYTGSAVNIYLNEVLLYTGASSGAITNSAFDLIIGDAYTGILDEMVIATTYSSDFLDPITTYPYVYNGYVDTTACSWTVSTLTYNFTGVYIRQNSTYPITYAKINFTDGVSELGLSYTVSTTTFDCIGDEEGTEKLSLVSRSYTLSGNAATLQGKIRIEETVQSYANVDLMLYCTISGGSDSLTIEDRFSIYGIGGVTTTTIVGDGAQIAGGSVLDIMATNSTLTGSGSSIRVDTVTPNFQHVHVLTHIYQNAQWDAGSEYWDCPSEDTETAYVEYGVDYMFANCTWTSGWKVRIEVVDGTAGTLGLSNNEAWVRLNVTWWNQDEIVKFDDVWAMYEACNSTDVTTQFSLYIDLWISSDEFSSNVAGHVSSAYYGMSENGWWIWSSWAPVGSLSTESFFFDNLYDEDGNVTTASTLKMFRVWSKIAKVDPGTSCDEHLWASINEVLQIKSLPYSADLVGISTPVFMPTTTPDMPLGFFASIGNILAGALDAIYYAIAALAEGAYSLTASVLDSVFGAFGVSNFTTSLTSFLGGIATYFATSITYIGELIVAFFTLFASIGIFLIEWIGGFINAIISIGNGVVNILTGNGVLTETFSVEVLSQTWEVVATLISTGAMFIFLAIYWFDSIDNRAKTTGQGWMGIFMSDINNLISVFSFLLDLAWRIVSTVIDLSMRFINIFL